MADIDDWLANLRRLCSKATPRPWMQDTVGFRVYRTDHSLARIALAGTSDDAAFIAAAREAVPRLLDMVEELQHDWNRLLEHIRDAASAADPAFTEQFDPWEYLRRITAEMIPARDHEIARLKAQTQAADKLADVVTHQQRCGTSACSNGDLCVPCSTAMEAALRAYEEVKK